MKYEITSSLLVLVCSKTSTYLYEYILNLIGEIIIHVVR